MRKVKMMAGKDHHISDEYAHAIDHFIDVITQVAKKYVDLDKYEIWTENWADTVFQGHPLEYNVQYLYIYLIDKSTRREEFVGRIEIGDNRWDHVDSEKDGEDVVALYSDRYIREQADELFAEWAKEVDEA